MKTCTGFTLLELFIALAIGAILLTVSAPTLTKHLARNRLISAAEAIQDTYKLARTEAITRSTPIHIRFISGHDWCVGFSSSSLCNCTERHTELNTDCGFPRVVNSSVNYIEFPHITLRNTSFTNNHARVDPVRGTVTPGSIYLQNEYGDSLKIIVSMLGRVRICVDSKKSSSAWYTPC